jgi:acyl dehydratase
MGRSETRLHLTNPPGLAWNYARAILSRRPRLLPAGTSIPRLEGSVSEVRIDPRHLERYRAVCGFPSTGQLPITYPHVLAISLQVAVMSQPAFVLRLLGLIHIANEITWLRPLPDRGAYGVRCWIEGHRDTDRGQEFELFTELLDREGPAWLERCTVLARNVAGGSQAARAARAALRAPKPGPDTAVEEVLFEATHRKTRSYALGSGDLNPIHLTDMTARWFGFNKAVAHGMWTMGRSLAALGPDLTSSPCRIPVEFKLPVFLPAEVRLSHWRQGQDWNFVLRDAATGRPHLAGSVERG